MCVVLISEKLRLLLYTGLIDRVLEYTFNTLQPSGHYIYHQFNIQQSFDLPTQLYLCVLCGSEKKLRLFTYTTLTDTFL